MDNTNEKLIIEFGDGYYISEILNEMALNSVLDELNTTAHKRHPILKKLLTSFVFKDKDHNCHIIFDILNFEKSELMHVTVRAANDSNLITKEHAELLLPVFEKLKWPLTVLYYALNQVSDENGNLHDITRLPHGFICNHSLNLKHFTTNEEIVLPVNMRVKGSMHINLDKIELPLYLEVDNELFINSSNKNIRLPYGLNVGTIHVASDTAITHFGCDTVIRKDLSLFGLGHKLSKNIKLEENIGLYGTNITDFQDLSLPLKASNLYIEYQNFKKLPEYKLQYGLLSLIFKYNKKLQEKIPENIIVENLILAGLDASLFPNVLKVVSSVSINEIEGAINLSNWEINNNIILREIKIDKLPNFMELDTLVFQKVDVKEMPRKLIIGDLINLTETKIDQLPEIVFTDKEKLHQFVLNNMNVDEIPEKSLINFKGRIVLSNMKNFPKLPENLHPDTRVHLISYLDDLEENIEPITLEEYNRLYFPEGNSVPKI